MKNNELKVYETSIELAEELWESVSYWNNTSKNSVGKQIIRVIDSVTTDLGKKNEAQDPTYLPEEDDPTRMKRVLHDRASKLRNYIKKSTY